LLKEKSTAYRVPEGGRPFGKEDSTQERGERTGSDILSDKEGGRPASVNPERKLTFRSAEGGTMSCLNHAQTENNVHSSTRKKKRGGRRGWKEAPFSVGTQMRGKRTS